LLVDDDINRLSPNKLLNAHTFPFQLDCDPIQRLLAFRDASSCAVS
jgi:hypothetical protein